MRFEYSILLATAAATTLKVGVISDPHYNPYYEPYTSANNCIGNSGAQEDYAPIGRYGCDSGPQIFDLLMQRFKAQFGEVDVLIVPGDHTAHQISAKDTDPNGTAYANVKKNLQATWAKLTEHFPNTLILPTIGNNDGRYHDQAIDEGDKTDYYSFVYNLWFKTFAPNQKLNLSEIQSSIKQAGQYRADINSGITVLQLNSMYMAYDDKSTHGGEQSLALDWLQYQLSLARTENRKVILLDHIYAGARYSNAKLWWDQYNSRYFQLLRDNHDIVIMEIAGHDHFGDVRYHSSKAVADLKDLSGSEFFFHNLLVSPGLTAYGESNPGVSYLEITDNIPHNLKMEFVNIGSSLGKKSVTYADADFNSVDFSSYGLAQLDAASISKYHKTLGSQDQQLTLNYLVAKLGFNPKDKTQYNQGLDLLKKKNMISSTKLNTDEYLCLMSKSTLVDEYINCTGKNELFLQ